MKGLLLNNIYIMKKDNTIWVYVSLIFAVMCCSCADIDLRLFALAVFAFASTIFFAKNGGAHIDALPFSKIQIVSERYLWSLIGIAFSVIIAFISTVIRYFALEPAFGADEIYRMISILSLSSVSAGISVFVSFLFKPIYGIMVHAFLSGMFVGSVVRVNYDREVALILIAVAVIVLTISWLASIKIYKKQGVK